MMRFLVNSINAITRLLLHERIWAVFFALSDRFVAPHLNRARGKASLWHVEKVPSSVRVHGRITILAPHKLAIGEYVRIGGGCFFHCLGGLTIGDNTQISRDVVIYTANHEYEGEAIPYDDRYLGRPVTIGRSVWIGMRVCIVPGVSIGDGAVIGMGAVVAKDVPAGAIVVGSPQREIQTRDLVRFRDLDAKRQWFGRIWPDN